MPTENRSSNTEQMVSPLRVDLNATEPEDGKCCIKMDFDTLRAGLLVTELGAGKYCIELGFNSPEDLHQALDELRALLDQSPSDGFSAGDMADQGAKAFAARDQEVNELRAQLAEAQEVLRDCIEVGELDAETQWKAERVSKGRRLYVDDRALSASAALERQP